MWSVAGVCVTVSTHMHTHGMGGGLSVVCNRDMYIGHYENKEQINIYWPNEGRFCDLQYEFHPISS